MPHRSGGEYLQRDMVITVTLGFGARLHVTSGVDWLGSGADRQLEYGSLGCEGEVLLPAVAWCRV